MRNAVKFTEDASGNWFIEGLILPIGGPRIDGQDLTGSHFTKSTDYCLDWFPEGGRPGLYRHGFDPDVQASVIGREVKSWKDSKGRWLRAQIDKAHEYAGEIKQMLDDGLLLLSSGAVDHLVNISTKSGEITRWPWVEWSLVPNAANPEALAYQVKSADVVAHLAVIGEAPPPALKASEAATDAANATYTVTSLLYLLGDEENEAQAAKLRVAIDAIQQYITAETAEIGTPEDQAETAAEQLVASMLGGWLSLDRAGTKEGRRNSTSDQTLVQTIHDHAASLGADCAAAGKSLEIPPAPVLAIKAGDDVEPVTDDELVALKSLFRDAAVAEARRLTGR